MLKLLMAEAEKCSTRVSYFFGSSGF